MSVKLDFRATRTMRLTRALVRAFEAWREADAPRMASYGLHLSEFDVLVHHGGADQQLQQRGHEEPLPGLAGLSRSSRDER